VGADVFVKVSFRERRGESEMANVCIANKESSPRTVLEEGAC
jgi:hypothetical protein